MKGKEKTVYRNGPATHGNSGNFFGKCLLKKPMEHKHKVRFKEKH